MDNVGPPPRRPPRPRVSASSPDNSTRPAAKAPAETGPRRVAVVFQDVTTDFSFLTRSTLGSKETIKWEDGNEYPLIKVEISSSSHPFYTGKQKILDSGGRVARFEKRFGKREKATKADA